MNWCKSQKDRNWEDVMFSDKWILYLKVQGGIRWMMKINSICTKGQIYS